MDKSRIIQHYVPQFYLRKFASDAQKPSQVYCFDKKTGRMFLSSTKNIGSERHFYDVGGSQNVEKTFAELEGKFDFAYQKLLTSENIRTLSTTDKVGLAVLVATQHMRTRSFRNVVKEAADFVLQNLENSAESQSQTIESLRNMANKEKSAKRFQNTLMGNGIADFAMLLLQMKWVLFVNETNMPFWSSDNPFTYSNVFRYSDYDGLGFERPGSQTHFPLSPRLSLEIVDPIAYLEYPNIIYIDDENNVIFNNHLQVKNARRYIFSSNGDFSLAERMIRHDPQLKETDRNRFVNVEFAEDVLK